MKDQKQLLRKAGIEIVGDKFTINDELETRRATSRKINRSIDNLGAGNNYDVFDGLDLDTLKTMKAENDAYIQKLYDLKKEISPFKHIAPKISDKFEEGAIVFDCWGWEQTNIDFYCIVRRSGLFVTMLPMLKQSEFGKEIGAMSSRETPTEIDFRKDTVMKKIAVRDGKEVGFSMRRYVGGGWVSLYDGTPETATHYA